MMTLLAWLPNEFMVVGIVLIGLGLMFGLLTLRRAGALLGFVVLLMLSGPFVDSLVDTLFALAPWWLLFLLGILVVFSLLGALSRLVIGREATGHMVGTLAADTVRFGFRVACRLIALPFRLLVGGANMVLVRAANRAEQFKGGNVR
jgi:hypothetical protein